MPESQSCTNNVSTFSRLTTCKACASRPTSPLVSFRTRRPPLWSRYHTACLTPQQRQRSPTERRWACPQCARRALLGRGLDGILAVRGGGAAREYRVKWAGRSHLHCEWVKEAELEEAAALYPGLRLRLKHFRAKHTQQAQVGVGTGGKVRLLAAMAGIGGVPATGTAHFRNVKHLLTS